MLWVAPFSPPMALHIAGVPSLTSAAKLISRRVPAASRHLWDPAFHPLPSPEVLTTPRHHRDNAWPLGHSEPRLSSESTHTGPEADHFLCRVLSSSHLTFSNFLLGAPPSPPYAAVLLLTVKAQSSSATGGCPGLPSVETGLLTYMPSPFTFYLHSGFLLVLY